MAYDIATMLAQWQQLGVFDYVLPFLLIFAVVYGILTATNVMSGNKGVNIIISLAIGLLSLRFEFVPLFFSQIFPRFGVGIAVFLVLMIFAALWIPKEHLGKWSIGFSITGVVIALVVIYNSFDWFGWTGFGGGFWDQYGSLVILGILLILVIASIAMPKINSPSSTVGHDSFGPIKRPE